MFTSCVTQNHSGSHSQGLTTCLYFCIKLHHRPGVCGCAGSGMAFMYSAWKFTNDAGVCGECHQASYGRSAHVLCPFRQLRFPRMMPAASRDHFVATSDQFATCSQHIPCSYMSQFQQNVQFKSRKGLRSLGVRNTNAQQHTELHNALCIMHSPSGGIGYTPDGDRE